MTRDYTRAATLTLLLYFLGYIPGLVVNLINLASAASAKSHYGSAPGFGCLVWLLIVCGLGPVVLFFGAYFILLHLY